MLYNMLLSLDDICFLKALLEDCISQTSKCPEAFEFTCDCKSVLDKVNFLYISYIFEDKEVD